ncbi:hypothetical protein CT138_06885 [Mannheimia varigena]|uniref:Panacea domain-containing protein n=1 Tax=Mannheimia varigena TaxID=85404 RepID=UPI000DBF0A91|nr:type II toxin-antitoxin system antitoxin SocA domain-containing protein [Mannheimia varigena]AWW34592.1 hypothetical protein CT138_06885 [Mannheimia varigena]
MQNKKVFFNNVNELIAYLYTKVGSLSPLKLQKGLYFLYAYYSAMYGIKHANEESESDYNLPKELFSAEFEAWNYGPVIRSVYMDRKLGEDKYQEMARKFDADLFFNDDNGKEVKSFIDDLFSQISKASDFSLVDRSHEDKAWENAFSQGKSTIIPNQAIIDEYKTKFARKQ